MVDEALMLERVNQNDSEAFAELSDKYSGLIHNLVAGFTRDDMTFEDIEDMTQEAHVLLYKAARTYNADSGLTFGLYARTCVKNGLISLERRRRRAVRRVDAEISEFDIAVPDTTDHIDETQAMDALMERIKTLLSPLELSVFKCLVLEYKHSEICEKLGISAKSTENAVFRIKKKLGTLLF